MTKKANKTEVKTEANIFEKLRLKAGFSRPKMAKLLGVPDQEQIYKLERRNTKITTEWLQRYALALNIPVHDIMSNKETINLDKDIIRISNTSSIPVYGMAAPGDPETVIISSESIVENILFQFPSGVNTPQEAFGVIVRGESMTPRFLPNEIVIANPNIMPRKNGECVVEMADGTASIKIYVGRYADRYVFSQYNTEMLGEKQKNQLEINVDKVKRLCAIIGHHLR